MYWLLCHSIYCANTEEIRPKHIQGITQFLSLNQHNFIVLIYEFIWKWERESGVSFYIIFI